MKLKFEVENGIWYIKLKKSKMKIGYNKVKLGQETTCPDGVYRFLGKSNKI